MARLKNITPQEADFIDLVGYSELGQEIIKGSDGGYDVLVGSTPQNIKKFHSYADHPRQLVRINDKLESTAAGIGQILEHIFDFYKKQGLIKDFSPESQETIILKIVKECHALDAINDNNVKSAIIDCHSRWASFPGANYGQHENKMADLVAYYQKNLKGNSMGLLQNLQNGLELGKEFAVGVGDVAEFTETVFPDHPHAIEAKDIADNLNSLIVRFETLLGKFKKPDPAPEQESAPQA